MVTPNRRRQAVVVLEDVFGVSQRRACKVVGQHRSTQRHQPKSPPDDDAQIRAELRAFAKKRPRWGWRRAANHLRRNGREINNKRVRRLWREEGLRVPQRKRKKRLTGIGTHVGAMCAIRPNAIWALDFMFDRTIDGRQVKILNVIDEFDRTALACEVDHSFTADDVVTVLDQIVAERGRAPAFIRMDNGPELTAIAIAQWCAETATGSVFIDPGSPWQNAWIESFNGRMRDELLNLWHFDSLLEAQVIIENWRNDYNTNRPHSAHGGLTPTEFHLQWTNQQQPQAA